MLSPLIGVVVGALVTLVLVILVVVVRVRRERVSKPRHEKPAELSELPPQQYPLQNPQQTVETDPDVIPNKFGKFLDDLGVSMGFEIRSNFEIIILAYPLI